MNICMKKIGMDQIKLPDNKVVGVTFLWCEILKVLGHKTDKRDGYSAMILGYGHSRIKSWNKAQHYLFKAEEVPERIYEYRTEKVLEVGEEIIPTDSFVVGSYVDVAGTSKGRGTAGCMKRWNFDGLRATHGVSKAHRKGGSTGQRNRPGKVFKGKKMPGHYGHERITVQSLKVVMAESMMLDGKNGYLLGVHGAVPGPNQGICFVQHAIKKGGGN